MANRTRLVCLHEGQKGKSVDPVFINKLIRTLKPSWVKEEKGNNLVRLVDCGGRSSLIKRMPSELKSCLKQGSSTTLMVWADVDDKIEKPDDLKILFRKEAEKFSITKEEFEQVVFIFAKDRLENWIEFLTTNATDESKEGPRVEHSVAAQAARKLAEICLSKSTHLNMPASLKWSCENWRRLVAKFV